MQVYLDLMQKVLNEGIERSDHLGVQTRSIFGAQMRFDLQEGFPILTTNQIPLKFIIYELLWCLKGDTNIKYLHEHDVTFFDEWADENGDLGPFYGKQWRHWIGEDGRNIDQISNVVHQIKVHPNSRRLIVSSWNAADMDSLPFTPCNLLLQFYVADGRLSSFMYQRSSDLFLGLPLCIASYSLLTMMIAQQCDLELGEFVWTGGDVFIEEDCLDKAKEQLSRGLRPLPQMKIKRCPNSIFDYKYEDFELVHYEPHPEIVLPKHNVSGTEIDFDSLSQELFN